jgi:hypothetical protein
VGLPAPVFNLSPHCRGITVETVNHFLLDCPHYRNEHHTLQRKLRRNTGSLSFLLNNPSAIIPLLKFVHATGRFKSYFNDNDKPQTNARKNADLRTAISNFVEFINN